MQRPYTKLLQPRTRERVGGPLLPASVHPEQEPDARRSPGDQAGVEECNAPRESVGPMKRVERFLHAARSAESGVRAHDRAGAVSQSLQASFERWEFALGGAQAIVSPRELSP